MQMYSNVTVAVQCLLLGSGILKDVAAGTSVIS